VSAYQDTHVIENPHGRVFAHYIGQGTVVLLVERDGKNMSIVLAPEDVRGLARFLMFDAKPEGELPVPASSRPAAPPPPPRSAPDARALPPAPTGAPAASAARSGARRGSTAEGRLIASRHERVAALFTEADDDYVSSRTGRRGRTAYVADRMRVTPKQASVFVTASRRNGYLGPEVRGSRGRAPGTVLPSRNGQVDHAEAV
jgi:hypothetical protein